MSQEFFQRHSDTFSLAISKYGLLPTIRTRLRDIILFFRRLYFVKVWKMDIHPFTLISRKAVLDRTYPRGVHIGEGSAVSFEAAILSHDHIMGKYCDTIIGKYCQIGARSMIMPGVCVGDHAVVGAGAVVTKDVPPNSIVVGNPARVVRVNIETTNWGKITFEGHKPDSKVA